MYALVDCNNFYVSCERVFDPSLNGKPVVILSNNDGCAISRSDEAKRLGIEMGAVPHLFSEAIKRSNLKMFSSNYTLYGDMSDRVMQTLAGFVPRIEVYSIDEAFLDMHDMPHEDLYALGIKIKKTIQDHLGIPVCVGIAPTKALAKMANRFAKKYNKAIGVYHAGDQAAIDKMLVATGVGDVWGIGRQYALMLKRNDLHTARDFVQAPETFVRNMMSVQGLRLQTELRGTPCYDWEEASVPKQNICCARSFGNLTTDKGLLQEAITNFTANCAEKLRQQHSAAREMTVFIQTNPHRLQDRQYHRSITMKMDLAQSSTPVLIKYALKAMQIIFKDGYNYMKCGIELRDLVSEDEVQLSLFSPVVPKENKAIKVLDTLNDIFGKETVRFGVQGFKKRYKARAELLSLCYTTRLADVIRVRS